MQAVAAKTAVAFRKAGGSAAAADSIRFGRFMLNPDDDTLAVCEGRDGPEKAKQMLTQWIDAGGEMSSDNVSLLEAMHKACVLRSEREALRRQSGKSGWNK